MKISESKVNDIILFNKTMTDVIDVSEWKKEGHQEVKTFVLRIEGKLFQGKVGRVYITKDDVKDSKGKVIKKGGTSLIYSHDGVGVDVVEVVKWCVNENGNRVIVYKEAK